MNLKVPIRSFFSSNRSFFLVFFCASLFISCKKKDPKVVLVEGNTAPYYDKVPRVKIENYVNRLFIDLIGREPFDAEMNAEVDNLMANNLSIATREALILKLQTDKTHRPGDSTFQIAFHKRLYDLLTVRLCEGFGENNFKDWIGESGIGLAVLSTSLQGNWAAYYENKALLDQLNRAARARWLYMQDSIDISDYCTILINNDLTYNKTLTYMHNEDNTVKYTFNDLFFRQYTKEEFPICRDMILFEKSGVIFGRSGHSKGDYFDIITHTNEFYEGTIMWLYKTFTARYPDAQEIDREMKHLPFDKDIIVIMRNIMKSDEYANF